MTHKYRPVIVEWIDAFDGDGPWVYRDEYKMDPANPTTIGWLLEDFHPDYVTLMSTFCLFNEKEDMYGNIMHIPKGMVKSLTYVDIPAKISRKNGRRSE